MSSPSIFQLLREIDKGNLKYFELLPLEEQKKVPMIVLYRWFSGTSDAMQLVVGNEVCNKHIFALAQHPNLLWKLIVSSASKRTKKYEWVASSKQLNYPLTTRLLAQVYGLVQDVPPYIADLIDPESAASTAIECGWDASDVKKLQEELKR